MKEIELDTIIDAVKNCLDKPKCRDCPWEECEYEHETVTMPVGLIRALQAVAHGVRRMWEGTYPKQEADAQGIRFVCGVCRSTLWVQKDTASLENNKKTHKFCSACGERVRWDVGNQVR